MVLILFRGGLKFFFFFLFVFYFLLYIFLYFYFYFFRLFFWFALLFFFFYWLLLLFCLFFIQVLYMCVFFFRSHQNDSAETEGSLCLRLLWLCDYHTSIQLILFIMHMMKLRHFNTREWFDVNATDKNIKIYPTLAYTILILHYPSFFHIHFYFCWCSGLRFQIWIRFVYMMNKFSQFLFWNRKWGK